MIFELQIKNQQFFVFSKTGILFYYYVHKLEETIGSTSYWFIDLRGTVHNNKHKVEIGTW